MHATWLNRLTSTRGGRCLKGPSCSIHIALTCAAIPQRAVATAKETPRRAVMLRHAGQARPASHSARGFCKKLYGISLGHSGLTSGGPARADGMGSMADRREEGREAMRRCPASSRMRHRYVTRSATSLYRGGGRMVGRCNFGASLGHAFLSAHRGAIAEVGRREGCGHGDVPGVQAGGRGTGARGVARGFFRRVAQRQSAAITWQRLGVQFLPRLPSPFAPAFQAAARAGRAKRSGAAGRPSRCGVLPTPPLCLERSLFQRALPCSVPPLGA